MLYTSKYIYRGFELYHCALGVAVQDPDDIAADDLVYCDGWLQAEAWVDALLLPETLANNGVL